MAVSDGSSVVVYKELGLVAQVFDEPTLASLQRPPRDRPHPLLDHRRRHLGERPAHRFRNLADRRQPARLGHNGNLTNTSELAAPGRRRSTRAPARWARPPTPT